MVGNRLVILLRGINVGSHNKLPMPSLKELLTGLGYEDPVTYLQSGNAVVTTTTDPGQVEKAVTAAIFEHLGLSVPTVVRTAAEFRQAADTDPYAELVTDPDDLKRYQVVFLSAGADPAGLDGAGSFGEEKFCVIGREIYSWTPAGVHTAKLTHARIERLCGGVATARNRRTVLALAALLDASPA